MTTLRDRIIAYLSEHSEGADDDELAAKLGVSHRQSVNQSCRGLVKAEVVRRLLDGKQGKIINYLIGDAPVVEVRLGQQLAAFPSEAKGVAPPGELHDSNAAKAFADDGEVGLSEDMVKDALRAALEAEGWSVKVAWGHAHGIDIDATRQGGRRIIEAKGEGSLPPMRVNYFLGALGELLQRMEGSGVSYALALPAHRQFVTLFLGLSPWIRERLQLGCYLVRPVHGGAYEVAFLPAPVTPPPLARPSASIEADA